MGKKLPKPGGCQLNLTDFSVSGILIERYRFPSSCQESLKEQLCKIGEPK